jgi:hypothetical protein
MAHPRGNTKARAVDNRREWKGTNARFADFEGCFCALPLASERVYDYEKRTKRASGAPANGPAIGSVS